MAVAGALTERSVALAIEARLGGPLLRTPRGRDAIVLALQAEGLAPTDHVCVITTSGRGCISPCVRWALGRCQWGRQPEERTRAVLLIHEWGVPHPDTEAIASACRRRGWVLIEDCAHAFATALWSGAVGRAGDWATYSMPKFTPLPAGGLLRAPPALAPSLDRFPALTRAVAGRERNHEVPHGSCLRGPGPARAPVWPDSWERELKLFLAGIADTARERRATWHEIVAAASLLGGSAAVPLPPDAVPWRLPLRVGAIHRLVGALAGRGVAAEACVHVWAALVPCDPREAPPEVVLAALRDVAAGAHTVAAAKRVEGTAWWRGTVE